MTVIVGAIEQVEDGEIGYLAADGLMSCEDFKFPDTVEKIHEIGNCLVATTGNVSRINTYMESIEPYLNPIDPETGRAIPIVDTESAIYRWAESDWQFGMLEKDGARGSSSIFVIMGPDIDKIGIWEIYTGSGIIKNNTGVIFAGCGMNIAASAWETMKGTKISTEKAVKKAVKVAKKLHPYCGKSTSLHTIGITYEGLKKMGQLAEAIVCELREKRDQGDKPEGTKKPGRKRSKKPKEET